MTTAASKQTGAEPQETGTLPTATRLKEIKGLTSLRGIAAFYIVLLHFSKTAQDAAQKNIPTLAPAGVLAVDLFFVLSGFIMAYTYLEDFKANGLRAYFDFLGRRFARIQPLNIFLLLLLSATTLLSVAAFDVAPFPEIKPINVRNDLIFNLLLLHGVGFGHNLNGPSWSISDEFAAYLIFPILLGAVFHRRLWVCALSVVVSLSYLILMASKQPNFHMDPTNHGIYWDIGRCVFEFTLGLASFRFFSAARYAKLLTSDISLVIIAGAIATIILLRLGELFAVLLFPFLILAIARNTGRMTAIIENKALYFMGLVSYSLYLIHDPIRPLASRIIGFLHPEPLSVSEAIVFAIAASLSVIPLAWMTYRFVELPGRKLFRKILK